MDIMIEYIQYTYSILKAHFVQWFIAVDTKNWIEKLTFFIKQATFLVWVGFTKKSPLARIALKRCPEQRSVIGEELSHSNFSDRILLYPYLISKLNVYKGPFH